jgi:hypothetical protein
MPASWARMASRKGRGSTAYYELPPSTHHLAVFIPLRVGALLVHNVHGHPTRTLPVVHIPRRGWAINARHLAQLDVACVGATAPSPGPTAFPFTEPLEVCHTNSF